jgi:hypothetical protein
MYDPSFKILKLRWSKKRQLYAKLFLGIGSSSNIYGDHKNEYQANSGGGDHNHEEGDGVHQVYVSQNRANQKNAAASGATARPSKGRNHMA